MKLISSDYCRFTDSLLVHDNLLSDYILFAMTAPIKSVLPPWMFTAFNTLINGIMVNIRNINKDKLL